jgi:ribonuclease J
MYDFYGTELFPFEEGPDAAETLRKLDKMRKEGFIAIVSETEHYQKIMDALQDVKPVLVYSMWEGYIDPKKENCYNKNLADFCKKYNAIPKHTSGHAYPSFIAQVITAVNPTQCIWPIHTEFRDSFFDLDISDELKAKIKK